MLSFCFANLSILWAIILFFRQNSIEAFSNQHIYKIKSSFVKRKSVPANHLITPTKGKPKSRTYQNGSSSSTCLSSTSVPSQFAAKKEQIAQKEQIYLLLEKAPNNVPTPPKLSKDILCAIGKLEDQETTAFAVMKKDNDEFGQTFLNSLSGNWELLWTTQDENSPESNQLFSFINPLENQAYSNNPSATQGRLNPILPRGIQDQLENLGILTAAQESGSTSGASSSYTKSSQSIDIKKQRVRNVVSFQLQLPKIPLIPSSALRGSLALDITFKPSPIDSSQIDVKFQSCRIQIFQRQAKSNEQEQKQKQLKQVVLMDQNIPLGIIGPTGWLRTTYMDDDFRITRGHKGSVFVLSRSSPSSA